MQTIRRKFYTLYHADAIEWLRSRKTKSIQAVVTDPPYGAGYVSNHREEKFDPIKADQYFPFTLMHDFLYMNMLYYYFL